MADEVIGQGIYAGIPYTVVAKGGKKYIGLGLEGVNLIAAGANPKLLNDIGDQNPDEVMASFLESMPEKKED